MPKEISNNVLAVLVVVALVAVVAGMYMTLANLQRMGVSITGFNTQTGNISVNITQDTTIYLTNASIDFGNGYVNDTSRSNATIDSEGTVAGGSWAPYYGGFVIRNDGNIRLNITVQSAQNATTWIGTGALANYKMKNNESNSCDALQNSGGYTGNLVTTETLICNGLWPNLTADSIQMVVQLTIPDTATGQKTVDVTFTSIPA